MRGFYHQWKADTGAEKHLKDLARSNLASQITPSRVRWEPQSVADVEKRGEDPGARMAGPHWWNQDSENKPPFYIISVSDPVASDAG